jgi:predicted methyltransferase
MAKWRIGVAVSLLGLVGLGACSRATRAASAPSAQTQQQAQRPTSTPYSGDLSIFESPGREKRLQIDRVMKLLKISKGSAVADIGAGSGWFTVRAARRVGPDGVVYAEDINP